MKFKGLFASFSLSLSLRNANISYSPLDLKVRIFITKVLILFISNFMFSVVTARG